MIQQIKQSVERTISNIRFATIGIITSVLKSKKEVFVRIAQDEELRDIKHISHYGFFSLPLNGQNGQLIFNNSSKKVSFIGVEQDSIPIEINPGEAIIYSSKDKYILISDNIYIKGDIKVDGNIECTGDIKKG